MNNSSNSVALRDGNTWSAAQQSLWENSTERVDSFMDRNSQFYFALYHVTIPLLFGLISTCGVTGNALVIYVILSRRRMRTVINILLLNLALADLLFALVIPPCTAYVLATEQWLFGDVACKLMHYVINVTAYVTVYTLVLVSVNRYMTIVHSTSTARFRTRQVTVATILGVWTVMVLVNSPVLSIYGSQRTGNGSYECDLHDFDSGRPLFATFFVFGYLYPLVIIAVFSGLVLFEISSHRRRASPQLRRQRSTRRRRRRTGRMLVAVVVVFALLWLPVHVHLLVAFFGTLPTDQTYQAVTILWHCLAYVNSCVNPLIYNRTSREFRQAFSETVARCCCFCCCWTAGGRAAAAATEPLDTSRSRFSVSTFQSIPRVQRTRRIRVERSQF